MTPADAADAAIMALLDASSAPIARYAALVLALAAVTERSAARHARTSECVNCGKATVPTELGPCHDISGQYACTFNGPNVAEPIGEPLPDVPMYRAMRAGHERRTGHELVAHIELDGGGIGHVVRQCCE